MGVVIVITIAHHAIINIARITVGLPGLPVATEQINGPDKGLGCERVFSVRSHLDSRILLQSAAAADSRDFQAAGGHGHKIRLVCPACRSCCASIFLSMGNLFSRFLALTVWEYTLACLYVSLGLSSDGQAQASLARRASHTALVGTRRVDSTHVLPAP